MKQRISALDLQLISSELHDQLVGYRLRNIYNIAESNRQFLLKFGKPDSKLNVVIDCGLRVHITEFSRPTPPAPSWFVSKLRQYLKEKRLTEVKQVPNDRIIVFTFADGMFYLVLEFFSAGNVLLLDSNHKIILLQRVVEDYEMKIGQTYTMLDSMLDQSSFQRDPKVYTEQELRVLMDQVELKAKTAISNVSNAKNKKALVPSIQKLLFLHSPPLSSDLIQNALKSNEINPSESCLNFKEDLNTIVDILNQLEKQVDELITSEGSTKKGYIVTQKNKLFDETRDAPELEYSFSNFHPFKPYIEDNSDIKLIEVDGPYNNTVDKFFSTIESTKYATRLQNQDMQAKKKILAAKSNNESIIQSLLDAQRSNEEKGNILIANAELVEEARSAVQALLNQQMDWTSMEKLIKNEQVKGNKIASLILLPMDLKNNKITLLLPKEDIGEAFSQEDGSNDTEGSSTESDSSSSDFSAESDSSDFEADDGEHLQSNSNRKNKNSQKNENRIRISIDLNLSAFANASSYYDVKKATSEKQKKVEVNAEKALKSIKQKIDKDLKKKQKESHDVLKAIRNPYFFEKYYWFISSEGFIVVMGKGLPETDQIYSKYINENDIFVSNSYENKAWILNPEKTNVPPNTLMQAGIFVTSATEAWSKKAAVSPWWCYAKNLSKFDDIDGSVLPAGIFRMKKSTEKNMMPPAPLVMGLALLWKIKTEGDDISDEDDSRSDLETHIEKVIKPDDGDVNLPIIDTNLPDPVVADVTKQVNDLGFNIGEFDDVALRGSSKDLESDEEHGSDSEEELNDTKTIATKIVENMNTKVRGKKGKLKKMQRKYGNQDDEERLLRLEALGTLKGIEREQQKKVEEMERYEKREFKKQIRKKQELSRALTFSKSEKAKVDYSKIFNQLKSTITKDDVIVDVIPIFAPWPALSKYKYKVKVQPGNAKKTKSINEILSYFLSRNVDPSEADKEADWLREHEIIKHIKGQEIVPLISVDKMKLTIPGSNEKSNKPPNGKSKRGKGSKR